MSNILYDNDFSVKVNKHNMLNNFTQPTLQIIDKSKDVEFDLQLRHKGKVDSSQPMSIFHHNYNVGYISFHYKKLSNKTLKPILDTINLNLFNINLHPFNASYYEYTIKSAKQILKGYNQQYRDDCRLRAKAYLHVINQYRDKYRKKYEKLDEESQKWTYKIRHHQVL